MVMVNDDRENDVDDEQVPPAVRVAAGVDDEVDGVEVHFREIEGEV